MDLDQLSCCGVAEVIGVQHAVDAGGAEAVIAGVGTPRHPFLILTGIVTKSTDRGCGEVAAYITEHRLGEVTATPTSGRNPNSGNHLKVWVWKVNKVKLRAWRLTHRTVCAAHRESRIY